MKKVFWICVMLIVAATTFGQDFAKLWEDTEIREYITMGIVVGWMACIVDLNRFLDEEYTGGEEGIVWDDEDKLGLNSPIMQKIGARNYITIRLVGLDRPATLAPVLASAIALQYIGKAEKRLVDVVVEGMQFQRRVFGFDKAMERWREEYGGWE